MSRARLRLVMVIAAALVAGFLIGTWRSGATIHTGRADSAADGRGTILTGEWAYGFDAGVTWIDTANVWHFGGAPACLPPLSSAEDVRFAAVEVTVEGQTWRPVVWIDCRSVAPG